MGAVMIEKLHQWIEHNPDQWLVARSLLLVAAVMLAKEIMGGFALFYLISIGLITSMVYRWIVTENGIFAILRDNFSILSIPRNSDNERSREIPWVTVFLILLNTLIFIGMDEVAVKTISAASAAWSAN